MSFKMLQNLEEIVAKLNYEEATKDALNVRAKCDAAMASYRRLRDALKELTPIVEQNRGLTRGLELSVPIVGQFKVLVKSALEKDELDKEAAVAQIQLLTKVETALIDSSRQRKEELIRALGRMDGIYEAAVKNLDQIKDYLTGLSRQSRFMDENPHLFGEPEVAKPQIESIPASASAIKEEVQQDTSDNKKSATFIQAVKKAKAKTKKVNGKNNAN